MEEQHLLTVSSHGELYGTSLYFYRDRIKKDLVWKSFIEEIGGGLINASLGSFALTLAAVKSMKYVEAMIQLKDNTVDAALEAVKIIGLPGLVALFLLLILGLIFLSIACGIISGVGAMTLSNDDAMRTRVGSRFASVIQMSLTGLAMALGSGIGGAVLGSILIFVMTAGPKGLCITGLIFSISLLPMRTQINMQNTSNQIGLLVLFMAVEFMTIFIGVWVGISMSRVLVGNPAITIFPFLFLVSFILIPLAYFLVFLVMMVLSNLSTLNLNSFGFAVTGTGFVFGFNAGSDQIGLYDTPKALLTLVHLGVVLAGLAGSALGVILFSSLVTDRVGWVSVSVSVTTVLILSNIQDNVTMGARFGSPYLGPGWMLGLLIGMAGAAGMSLGAVGIEMRKHLSVKELGLAGLASVIGTILGDPTGTFSIVATVLVAMLALPKLVTDNIMCAETPVRFRNGHELLPVAEAALSSAALGAVAVGALVLGAAGILTSKLGSFGWTGVLLAAVASFIIEIWIWGFKT